MRKTLEASFGRQSSQLPPFRDNPVVGNMVRSILNPKDLFHVTYFQGEYHIGHCFYPLTAQSYQIMELPQAADWLWTVARRP